MIIIYSRDTNFYLLSIVTISISRTITGVFALLFTTTVDSPTCGDMLYIGSTSLTGSDSDCASRCSNVSTAWLLNTWPSSADLSPASTHTSIYDLLTLATFHELDCQQTAAASSVCSVCSSCLSQEHCLYLT